MQSSQELKISIYPNPANHSIHINLSQASQVNEIEIYNLQSVLIKKIAITEDSKNIDLNISDYPSGVYLLRFNSNSILDFTPISIVKE